MRSVLVFCVFLPFTHVFAQTNKTDSSSSVYDKSEIKHELQKDSEEFWSDVWSPAATETEHLTKDAASLSLFPISKHEEGRSKYFKQKKIQLQFFMKTFMVIKIIMGILLPLGILAAKIISWKSVTLSLMAFMMAATIFIKNLFMGSNSSTPPTTHFVPPVFIHGSPNDIYWKRQGDIQPQTYTWNTS